MELKKILYNLLINKDVELALKLIEENYSIYPRVEAEDLMEAHQSRVEECGEKLRNMIEAKVKPSYCCNCKYPNIKVDVTHENQVYSMKKIRTIIPGTGIDPMNQKLVAFDKKIRVICENCHIEYGTVYKMVTDNHGGFKGG